MNRNYKVIWNEALGCFTAVAEYAKARGKSSSSSVSSNATANTPSKLSSANTLRLSIIGMGLIAAGVSVPVIAATPCTGDTSVVCGTSAAASSHHGIAIGKNATALGGQSIAIGGGSSGQNTTAIGEQSIAIGANVVSKGPSSIAIGGDDLDAASKLNTDSSPASNNLNGGTVNDVFFNYTKRNMVEPTQYTVNTQSGGAASIAIGAKSLSQGDLSTAVGTHASASGVASSAFGVGSSATKEGSVAIGAGSLTDKEVTSETTMNIGYAVFDVAGSVLDANGSIKNGAQVSVGSKGSERQIKNVAGGRIAIDSTDAVNGSQLSGTNYAVNQNTKNINKGLNFGGDSGPNIKRKLGQKLNIVGDETVTGTISTKNITVISENGDTLSLKLNKDIDLGADGSVKTGNTLINNEGITLTSTDPIRTVTLSNNGLNNGGNIITNVGAGIENTDAVNVLQLKAMTFELGQGWGLSAQGKNANMVKPGDAVDLHSTDGNIVISKTADNNDITFNLNRDISLDSVTIAGENGPSMSVNGLYAGDQRVTGVAAGINATDAVNLDQLTRLDRRLGDNINELGYRIDDVEDDANAGISAAMAMSSLPQAYIIGKSMVSGGIAAYNGESAFAIGVSKLSDDGRWVIKANGTADTQGNVGGAIGAGFHFR